MRKNRLLRLLISVLALCLILSFSACSSPENPDNTDDGNGQQQQQQQTPVLNLSKMSVTLEKLETYILTAEVPEGAESQVEWSSSKEDVVTVANGIIKGVGAGNAVIIAKYDGKEGRCAVSVTDNKLVPDIQANVENDQLYIIKGDSFELTSTISYNNHVLEGVAINATLECTDGSITFENGVITAVSNGVATITLSSSWEGFNPEKVISIEVVDNMNAILGEFTEVTLYNDTRAGVTYVELDPVVYFEDKLLNESEYAITAWEYDEKILSINEDSYRITALSKGATTVKVTITSVEKSVSVVCELDVNVELYNDDKSEDVLLDVLFLDEDKYYLCMGEVYSDLTSNELTDLQITKVTDVTTGTTFDIPLTTEEYDGETYAVVDIESFNKNAPTGDRKWQVECGKYSYIVTVPTKDNNPAKPLVGIYDTVTWDYKTEIKFVRNKQVVQFTKKDTGEVVDFGTYTLAPWKGNTQNGNITILTDSGKIPGTRNWKGEPFNEDEHKNPIYDFSIRGYYYSLKDGSMQMSFALNGSNTYVQHLYKDLKQPFEQMSGEYTASRWEGRIVLNQDKTCAFILNGRNEAGTYALAPTEPFKGKVTLTFANDTFSGQKVLEGTYEFAEGYAEMILSVGGSDMKFKFGSDDYRDYDGTYISKSVAGYNSWSIRVRFIQDGTFIFDPLNWSKAPSIGTYTFENGEVSIVTVAPYNYNKNYNGTYEMRDNDGDGVKEKHYVIFRVGTVGGSEENQIRNFYKEYK